MKRNSTNIKEFIPPVCEVILVEAEEVICASDPRSSSTEIIDEEDGEW